jgi:hypothetical protein
MATLLGALLRNESGGRNIPNVHQGTSSGQAQGYFQITTGTWNEFGGNKYAPTPLQASYAQQAEIASKIPLRRWDKSTLAAMSGTGRPIDPNRTLGENLSMSGEGFGAGPQDHAASVSSPQAATDAAGPGQKPSTGTAMPAPGQPGGAMGPPNPPGWSGPPPIDTTVAARDPTTGLDKKGWRNTLAHLASGYKMPEMAKNDTGLAGMAMPAAARIDTPELPTFDPNQVNQQRYNLALAMQRLNSGRLF